MSPVPDLLSPHEKSSFGILAAILAEREAVDRDAMRVAVAARGGVLGRDYRRFVELRLVVEIEDRPNFFRRLFGAKTRTIVRLTERGRDLAEGSVEKPSITAVADARIEATVPEPDIAQETFSAKKDEGYYENDLRGEQPSPEERDCGVVVVSDFVQLKEEVQPTTPAKHQAGKRFAITDYTDVLGGQAEEPSFTVFGSERLDGLTESLGLLGFEMTPAGSLLAARRWSDGLNDAEVALDILVASFAHAVRLDLTGTARFDLKAMLSLIDMVELKMWDMVGEGQLTEERLVTDLSMVRGSVRGEDDAQAAILALLSDPVLGMAPPTILPEEVWLPIDGEDGAGDEEGQGVSSYLGWTIRKQNDLWIANDGEREIEDASLEILKDKVDSLLDPQRSFR